MMKTFKIVLITLFVALSFVACKKDEDGNYVSYYKNKTVIGYVYSSDSLVPIPDFKMHIEAIVGGTELFPSPRHVDYCYTDETGKFTFKFVKKINAKEVDGWYIGIGGEIATNYYAHYKTFDIAQVNNINNSIYIDTLFVSKELLLWWQEHGN